MSITVTPMPAGWYVVLVTAEAVDIPTVDDPLGEVRFEETELAVLALERDPDRKYPYAFVVAGTFGVTPLSTDELLLYEGADALDDTNAVSVVSGPWHRELRPQVQGHDMFRGRAVAALQQAREAMFVEDIVLERLVEGPATEGELARLARDAGRTVGLPRAFRDLRNHGLVVEAAGGLAIAPDKADEVRDRLP